MIILKILGIMFLFLIGSWYFVILVSVGVASGLRIFFKKKYQEVNADSKK